MDKLAIANSARWYDHVLWRENGHDLRRALDFKVKGRRGGQRGHRKSR